MQVAGSVFCWLWGSTKEPPSPAALPGLPPTPGCFVKVEMGRRKKTGNLEGPDSHPVSHVIL